MWSPFDVAVQNSETAKKSTKVSMVSALVLGSFLD